MFDSLFVEAFAPLCFNLCFGSFKGGSWSVRMLGADCNFGFLFLNALALVRDLWQDGFLRSSRRTVVAIE